MTGPHSPLRVLLVEDDADDAELVALALRHGGLSIEAQVVATEAEMRSALEARPDVVICDWSLPGFSGARALAMARELASGVPCILLSGTLGENLVIEALRNGARAYVPKSRLGALVPAVHRALADAEATRERDRLAATVEQSPSGIVIVDADLRIVYANPVYAASVGLPAAELVGRSAAEVMSIGLDETTVADIASTVSAGQSWFREVDHRNPDGTVGCSEVSISPLREANGEISGWLGVMRDVTERERDRAELAASEARLRTTMDSMVDGVVVASAMRDEAGRIVDFRIDYANTTTGLIAGVPADHEIGHTLLELFPAHRANGLFEAYVRVVETGVPFDSPDFHYVDPDAAGGPLDQYLDSHVARMGDGYYVLSVRDVTERHRAEREMRRLSTAVEQSADAVVITDTEGWIEYVNPAFEKVSGYTREEAIGQNPRILKSGVQDAAFYEAMWAALTSGQPFVGDLVNRAKDGSLFQEAAVISPVVGADGKTTSYVAVSHDVTRERALEAASVRLARERAQIAGVLSDLKAGVNPEATAEAICRQVVSLAGISSAALYTFGIHGQVMPLAFVRADGKAVPPRPLPAHRSEYLRERALEGPWIEAWVRQPGHPYDWLLQEMGVRAASFAPIRHGGDLVALLTITSSDEDAISRLTESLPALLEFAAIAGVLVGPAIADLTQAGDVRRRITAVIAERAFHPVFQPIVDLATLEHVGYEALTRFDSGQRPDLCFADARAVGLERDLELATIEAAVAAAKGLPAGRRLNLNVSPRLLTGPGGLSRAHLPTDRPIVLEITEHEVIEDYAPVREAVRALGNGVRLAVDDAGAGAANFSHIVELRPDYVKLDISLVRDVNTDLGRQALVVGMRHFSTEAGCRLLAEGIETEAEAATMSQLAVELGQGYLFGRPAPVETWANTAKAAAEPPGEAADPRIAHYRKPPRRHRP